MCAISCSFPLETRPVPSESSGLMGPSKARRSLFDTFSAVSLESSTSKDNAKETDSPLKRARVMQVEKVLSEEDRKRAMAKEQFQELIERNGLPSIDTNKEKAVIQLRRLESAKPTTFARFSIHANLVMARKCHGRFVDHGYLASDHSLVMKELFYHANYVKGDKGDIAAEAPNEATTKIFWQMLLQHEMNAIVMLTKFGPTECYDYCEGDFGDFKVRCITQEVLYSENEVPRIVRRTLEIQQAAEKRIRIPHIQVTNWEDDEALSIPTFRALLDITRHYVRIVAHCIAGIGRTGTFLTARMVYPRVRTESLEDLVPECANAVREARPGSIRECWQYQSIYDVMESVKANHITKTEEEKAESKK